MIKERTTVVWHVEVQGIAIPGGSLGTPGVWLSRGSRTDESDALELFGHCIQHYSNDTYPRAVRIRKVTTRSVIESEVTAQSGGQA